MANPKLKDLTNASASTLWRRANPTAYHKHVVIASLKRKGIDIPKEVKTQLTKCFHNAKQSSIIDNRKFSLTKDDVYRLWVLQDGKCNVSKLAMQLTSGSVQARNNMRVSIDRINNHLGYTKGNIHLVVWQFNNAKGSATVQETIEFCKAVATANP